MIEIGRGWRSRRARPPPTHQCQARRSVRENPENLPEIDPHLLTASVRPVGFAQPAPTAVAARTVPAGRRRPANTAWDQTSVRRRILCHEPDPPVPHIRPRVRSAGATAPAELAGPPDRRDEREPPAAARDARAPAGGHARTLGPRRRRLGLPDPRQRAPLCRWDRPVAECCGVGEKRLPLLPLRTSRPVGVTGPLLSRLPPTRERRTVHP